jgi:hypothetical protein
MASEFSDSLLRFRLSQLVKGRLVVADVEAALKKCFDIHDFNLPMELAVAGLGENRKVSLHSRLKISEVLDYLETDTISRA